MKLQLLQDQDHENIAIFIDGKNVIDYDDYVNFETAQYVLKHLGLDFESEVYYFHSDEIEDWNGFPQSLEEMMEYLELE